jgi:tetratricopeptide (TPR) repeat protein
MEMKQPLEADKALRRAALLQEKLVVDFPESPHFRHNLVLTLGDLGMHLKEQNQAEEAEKRLRAALLHCERLLSLPGATPAYHSVTGAAQHNLAMVLMDRKEYAEASRLLRQAITHQQRALSASPEDTVFRQYLRNHYWVLANAAGEQHRHAELVDAVQKAAALARKGWNDDFDAALYIASCIPLANDDPTLSKEKRNAAAQSYAEQAVQRLRQAVDKGFQNVKDLESNEALEPLRARADFQKVLSGLKARAAPQNPGNR